MTKPLRRMAGQLMDVLVPCRCLHCFDTEPGSMHLGLCSRCRQRLRPLTSRCISPDGSPGGAPRGRACDLCGGELETPRARATLRCIPCMQRNSPLDRLFCAWRYQEPLDAVIHGLKFRDLTYLGTQLASELSRLLPQDLEIDAVVPVPLHWLRSWTRGYNQAFEIARPLARLRGWRLEEALVRRRSTPPQSGLDRAGRLRNLRRAFASRQHLDGFGSREKRLLLIDDVYTTGATLEAAALALRAAGAAWVGATVAGRTPAPKY